MEKTKKGISLLLAFIMLLSSLIFVTEIQQPAYAETLSGKTAMQIMSDMDTGWNLGNTLDANGTAGLDAETSWGNPKTTKAMIDMIAQKGFKSVRIPVSWGTHTSGDNYTIDSAWMARVKEVVDYAIDNGLYVILNIHHDNDVYFYPNTTNKERSVAYVSSIWTQVSATFKDYDQHLIFETLNEPRLIGTDDEWWFNVNSPNSAAADAISVINDLNQTAVDAIRSSGGNNAERCIMVPGYCASIDGCTTSAFKLPDDSADNRLIVSVHAYTPYNFALNASGTSVFSDDLKSEVDYIFSTIKSQFIDKGIPVVIGEASASNKNNAAERLKWVNYYYGKAAALDVPVMLWDNNVYSGSNNIGEQHGYLNRLALQWYDQSLVDAMIEAYGNKPGEDDPDPAPDSDEDKNKTVTTLFTGSASASSWQQATSVMTIKNNGGVLDPAIIKETGYFYAEYTGDIGKIELIMQSWSGGTEWAKISLCESGTTDSGYYAKFSYADCLAAFSTGFTDTLDCVYVGALDGNITVTSLAYINETEKPAETVNSVDGFKLAGRASDALRLNWTKNDCADGYIIEMYDGSEWKRIEKLTDNTITTYRVTNLSPSVTYKFRICAYVMTEDSSALYSDYSNVTGTTNPSIVSGLKIGGRASDALRLNWTKNDSADGYIIENYNGNEWVRVAKVTSNTTTTYRVSGLAPSTTYKFRICAYNMVGSVALYSGYSNVTGTTNPGVVSGLEIGGRVSDAIRFNWTKNDSADGYIIENYNGSEWVRIAKITSNSTTTFKVSGLTPSTTYKFRICAYNMVGSVALYSGYSNITATTIPSKVAGLEIGGKASDALRLNWENNDSADGYIIEMYDGDKWIRITKLTSNETLTYRKSGLVSGTTYEFRICAYNMVGSTALYSAYSYINGTTN